MLDILISKFNEWSVEKADNFHNHALRGNLDGLYMWEKDENGFFMIRNFGTIYRSNDGMVHILTSARSSNDWNHHCTFYEQVKQNNSCRIDVPMYHENVILNGNTFYYKVFERPNKEPGVDYHQDIFENRVDTAYFLQYIKDANILINELKECNMTKKILYPKLGVTIFKRMVDSKGAFWIDFKYWTSDYKSFIETSYKTLETVIFYLEFNSIGKYNKEFILNEAKKEWNMI